MENWGLLEKASYEGYDVQVTFELNNEALELVHLYFRIPRMRTRKRAPNCTTH
mgnify:CR=1 FL=1